MVHIEKILGLDITIVQSVATAASGDGPTVAGTLLAILSGLNDVHVGAGPEEVPLAPLQGLPEKPDGAVLALQVGGDVHHVGLSSEVRICFIRH